jgi:soluble lytic murein transglycosylase-like protein
MYKYRKADGSLLVTTERRPSLELVEVISEGSEGGGSSTTRSSSGEQETEGADEDRQNRQRARRARKQHQKRATPPDAPVDRAGPLRRNRFDDLIREASAAYDVPFPFIKAVIRVESDFAPGAISSAGAMGLMQLMPATAAKLDVTDPFEPRQNVFGGTKLLRTLIDRYDGDINLILSAYNAGGGAVAEYDGIPYRKTRQYVASVYRWYEYYSRRQQEDSE